MDTEEAQEETIELRGRNGDDLVLTIFHELDSFKKVTPALVQKKYNLNQDLAETICYKVCLMRRTEARNFVKSIEV